MRRWNGWGDEATTYPLPESARSYLVETLGALHTAPDASREQARAGVPPSRLPPHPLISADPDERLLHARGHSLPDWVALRSGRIPAFPDGVAYPADESEVRALLDFCRQRGFLFIPYGAGSSVVGGINPPTGGAPVLTVDLRRMGRMLDLDEISGLASFEAGVYGPELEAGLQARGFTLGHYPQSFELSSLGGWIAARSSGQQSLHYGSIDKLFASGHLETPAGPFDLPVLTASAAGPDLRQLVLGSEGRLGVITRAVVRVRRLPEGEGFYGVFFHDWDSGAAACREMLQSGVGVSMLRLSDATETGTTLILSGKVGLVNLANRGLGLLGFGAQRCLLIYGATGSRAACARARRQVDAICLKHKGLPTGTTIGHIWQKSRFRTPYLRNALWEAGVTIDTLESALPWSKVLSAVREIQAAMRAASEACGEKLLVFAHLSHLYREASSFYITYLFRRSADPDELVERWRKIKRAASQVIQQAGGTISHQHGVGVDHLPWLAAEKGALGLQALQAAARVFDPDGMLNPGKGF